MNSSTQKQYYQLSKSKYVSRKQATKCKCYAIKQWKHLEEKKDFEGAAELQKQKVNKKLLLAYNFFLFRLSLLVYTYLPKKILPKKERN